MQKLEIQQLNNAELRKFGLSTGSIIGGLFGLLLPWVLDKPWPVWPWYIVAPLVGVGLVLPQALRPVYKGWMTFGHWAGWVNSKIILGIIYYGLMVPLGLSMKLLGRDHLHLKPNTKSHWTQSKLKDKTHFERPY
ncbi:MAG: SxtJ family membrane protein [bacterium]|nr:SxtJ family membrane protein [bacterium]